jgi:hypothetical protein
LPRGPFWLQSRFARARFGLTALPSPAVKYRRGQRPPSRGFAYATPEPDSTFKWKIGTNNTATAFDPDVGPVSQGNASATAFRFFADDLDPYGLSYGDYFNAARVYKNGKLISSATGGAVPPGTPLLSVPIDLNNLPLQEGFNFDVPTGKIGSLDAIVGGGAEYTGPQWVPWAPAKETDPIVRSYLDGSRKPDPGSDKPNIDVPSTDSLFAADAASDAQDWFPYFLAALNTAKMSQVAGQAMINDLSFNVPLKHPATSDGTWYVSEEALAPGNVPEPSVVGLVSLGLTVLTLFELRKRAHRQRMTNWTRQT